MSQATHNTPIQSAEFRSDLAWWQTFVSKWNGVSTPTVSQSHTHSIGCIRVMELRGMARYKLKWDRASQSLSIMVKEMIPIVLACVVWGRTWEYHVVHCHCDNQAVVACLRSRMSKNKHCMHMLRTLAFIEAHHCFHLHAVYINTNLNHIADDLSCDKLPSFAKVLQAGREPEPLPLPLLNIFLDLEADWISPLWHQQFNATFRLGLHSPVVWHRIRALP